MNMFADLANSNDIQGEDRDVLGGGYSVPESGAYKASVKVAYITESARGAKAVNFEFELDTGTTYRETIYVTSGKDKGGNNYYVDPKGVKKFLPGFVTVNTLCELATGKELPELDIQEKILNLYNYEARKEVPTKVPVVMDLLGKEIMLGLVKIIQNKRDKNDVGEYVDTPETREFAEISKVFYADGFTKTEKAGGATEPAFLNKWIESKKDLVIDKRTIKDGAAPKASGGGFTPNTAAQSAPQTSNAAPAVNSLFG